MLFAIQTTTHHVFILAILAAASLGAYALGQTEAGYMFAGAAVGAATIARDDRKALSAAADAKPTEVK